MSNLTVSSFINEEDLDLQEFQSAKGSPSPCCSPSYPHDHNEETNEDHAGAASEEDAGGHKKVVTNDNSPTNNL